MPQYWLFIQYFRFSRCIYRPRLKRKLPPGIRRFRTDPRLYSPCAAAADDCGRRQRWPEKKGGIWRLKPPPALGKRSLSFDSRHRHCPRRAKNAGGEYRQRGVAGSDLQQRFTAAEKIIPDLKFTAAFGRGRYVCPRNLTALASMEPTQTGSAGVSYEPTQAPESGRAKTLCQAKGRSRTRMGWSARSY